MSSSRWDFRPFADKFQLIQSGYVDLDMLVHGKGLAFVSRVGSGGLLGWPSKIRLIMTAAA